MPVYVVSAQHFYKQNINMCYDRWGLKTMFILFSVNSTLAFNLKAIIYFMLFKNISKPL